MTQHVLVEDTEDDIRTMRRLRNLILLFAASAVALAIGVTVLAP